MRHYGDITRLSGYELPVVDCITGGSPCQDLSVAGKRAGLDGERSGLFMEQIRIVKEMRERDRRSTGRAGWMVRPRYMVWENVPGAFSSNGGQDFQAVLTEIVRIADPEAPDVPMPDKGRWDKSGCLYSDVGDWSIAWRVHDAQYWGVPQRRKRIALVADFGGLSAPEVLFERKGLSGDPEPSRATGEEAAGGAGDGAESAVFCLQGNGIDRADTAGCNGRGWCEDVSYTLNTIDRPAVYEQEPVCIQRRFSNVSLSGDGITPTLEAGAGEGGNNTPMILENCPAVAYGIDQQGGKGGANYSEEVCPPILSDSHGTPHAVMAAGFSFGQSGKARSIGYQEEVSPTLRGGEGGNQKPCVLAAGFKGGQSTGGIGYEEEKSPTLSANPSALEPTVFDARGNGDGLIAPTITGDHENRVTDYTAVCVGNGQLDQITMKPVSNTLDTMHDQQAVMVEKPLAEDGAVVCVGNQANAVLGRNIFGSEVVPSLVASAFKGPGNTQDGYCVTSAIPCTEEPILLESNQNHATVQTDGISTALPASAGMGGGYVPAIVHTLKAKGNCQYREDSETYCVTAVDCRNGVENPDINGTLQAKSTGGIGVNFQNVCRVRNVVRRLTPLECERLQGYPDGWTDIGEWIDSKGKRHKEADSPRYKALGNSIALPFWFYLLRRISAQYERPATLGSLFDGIGGFPLCWERCNGRGTALWASEIEEFPIAVTKLRFPEVHSHV